MKIAKTSTLNLEGSSYQIGKKLGMIALRIAPLRKMQTSGWKQLDEVDGRIAQELFDRWCPGLTEEIAGFADALDVDPLRVTFCAMSYLKPACSQMVLLPSMAANGHTLQARNYEFSDKFEDFTLARTAVKGKYAHLGTTVLQLGREDGMNEHGFTVTMSSCGMPVGAADEMRKPARRGLQFFVIMRGLLENCRDVEEGLAYMQEVPLAYNINLIMSDRSGKAALVETMDGNLANKMIDAGSPQQFLHASNHVALPDLRQYETQLMRNSQVRYDLIRDKLQDRADVTADDLKTLLLRQYPEGMSAFYYDEFFGTTKSMVMDVNEGTIDLCWGGREENGWKRYHVDQALKEEVKAIKLTPEKPQPDFFEMISV